MGNKNKAKRPGSKTPGVNFQPRKNHTKGKHVSGRMYPGSAPPADRRYADESRRLSDALMPGLSIPGPLLEGSPAVQHSLRQSLGLGNPLAQESPALVMVGQQLTPQQQQLSTPTLGMGAGMGPTLGSSLGTGLGSGLGTGLGSGVGNGLGSGMGSGASTLVMQQQLQMSQRQIDMLMAELQTCKSSLNLLCAEQEQLQVTNVNVMAENEALKSDNMQLGNRSAQLEQQVGALQNRLDSMFNGGTVDVDRTYTYDRMRMVELAQLISRYLTNKPPEIDSNRIHGCLRRCASAARNQPPDNPPCFTIDFIMLMSIARACNWWTEKQMVNITEWLWMGMNMNWQEAPVRVRISVNQVGAVGGPVPEFGNAQPMATAG